MSNARFILPLSSLATTYFDIVPYTYTNHIVSCRLYTTSTDIVAPSDRFRFVDGIVNGLKSLRSFPISKVFGHVLVGCHGNHGSLDGTCHKKVSAGRPYVRPFPFQRYARSSRHTQKCACLRKAPNRYHKVRIVRYVRRAINVLLLPFECSCAQLAVSFSECSFIAACAFSISRWFI